MPPKVARSLLALSLIHTHTPQMEMQRKNKCHIYSKYLFKAQELPGRKVVATIKAVILGVVHQDTIIIELSRI